MVSGSGKLGPDCLKMIDICGNMDIIKLGSNIITYFFGGAIWQNLKYLETLVYSPAH